MTLPRPDRTDLLYRGGRQFADFGPPPEPVLMLEEPATMAALLQGWR